MDLHASTRFTLVALLTLAIGCADDGPSDDEAAGDTGSEDDSTSSSGSTDDTGSTDDADTSDATSSTDDATASTDTESTDDATESPETESTDDATETTDETTDTETTETTDTTDTGEEVMCPGVFPEFDKTCSNDDDCAVVIHTTDCCGNSVAWGINEAEVDAFEAAEAICDSQYPPCGCPSGPTLAEDGNQSFDPDDLAVECAMGSCTSFVL